MRPEPSTYTVTFDRIGRNHNAQPLSVVAGTADDLAAAVYKYARQFLASNDVEVVANLTTLTGSIFCGMQSGGSFTIEKVGA